MVAQSEVAAAVSCFDTEVAGVVCRAADAWHSSGTAAAQDRRKESLVSVKECKASSV